MELDLSMRLKLFRVACDLKQRDVAEALGVTTNYVSMLERGKREPTLEYVRSFAKLVGVPVAVLFWEPANESQAGSEVAELQARLATLLADYAKTMNATTTTE